MSSPSPPPPPPSPPAATEEEEEEEEEEERTDDEMDDIEWEESEDDDNVEEEEGYVDEGRRGSAGVRAAVAAMVEEHGAEAWPTCCVCMEPWTSEGAHRICCIPCGHVYGRSCLEKWLHRCGNTSAKCPQCGQGFGDKHITNLHVSSEINAWDDFCRLLQSRLQEQEARVAITEKEVEQLKGDVLRSNEENNKLERLMVDVRSEVAQADVKLTAQIENIHQSSWEESAQDAAAAVQAEFISMKEQLRKMAAQQNATPVDLLRFMEQNGAKLWEAIRSRPPPAATTTMED